MGVDCKITLPPAARLRDVADVIGALAGFPMRKQYFNVGGTGGWSAGRKHGDLAIQIKQCDGMPECATIHINNTAEHQLIDGEAGHFAMYHFEFGRNGEHGLMPPSTPFWCAIGRRLVDFFGGSVDFNDCDDSDVDYEQPERSDIHAEDKDEWYALQSRKLAVTGITKADMQREDMASYQKATP